MTFTPFDHASRLVRVGASLGGRDADWQLITARPDVRYLCGFAGSAGVLLVGVDRAVLVTDGRYSEVAHRQCPDVEVVIERDWIGVIARIAPSARIAIDPAMVSVRTRDLLEQAALVPVSDAGPLAAMRMVKDPAERERMTAACSISDRALLEVQGRVRVGVSERAIARWMRDALIDCGADDIAFPTIVATGVNGAQPHHVPDETVVQRGDLVTLDFGALVDGYHSDQTRTFAVGGADEWQREVYAVVAEAQRAARTACHAGVTLPDLDEAARSVIRTSGWADAYPHGLGHGLGLEIHEPPMIGSASTGILTTDTPITIEPGIYVTGRGGVRIEDTVWVGPEGSESLTGSSRELLVLG